MKNTKKILSLFSMAVIGISMVVQPISAITVNPTKQAQVQTRCGLITDRVNLILQRYNTNKEKHINRYQLIKEKTLRVINNLEGKGYDLTELKNDLTHLNQLTNEFTVRYNAYVDHLNKSKAYVCGNSEGAFKNEVDEARKDLLSARETSLEIRNFILSDIKVDLDALKAQVKNKV